MRNAAALQFAFLGRKKTRDLTGTLDHKDAVERQSNTTDDRPAYAVSRSRLLLRIRHIRP
jgi:hypothetical protein